MAPAAIPARCAAWPPALADLVKTKKRYIALKIIAAVLIFMGKNRGKINSLICGNKIAQAANIPSIAPDAPTIAIASRKPTATSKR